MLEVAFSQSVAGALCVAMGRKPGDSMNDGPMAVIGGVVHPESARTECVWTGGFLQGTSADVVCLNLYLEYGDLSLLPDRTAALTALYGRYEGVVESMVQQTQSGLERVASAQKIRLWVGEQDAGDLLGAFYLCHLLRNTPCQVSMVYVPMMISRDTVIATCGGAGDMTPEELSRCGESAHPLDLSLRTYMANRFTEILQQGGRLRVMLNGCITSVPETVYDPILLGCMPQGEFVLGRWLGTALGRLRGVSDTFLYNRIAAWIAEGTLLEVSPASEDSPYGAILRKADHDSKSC